MAGSGNFRERVTFSERAFTSDGGGGVIGDFADQFTVSARVRPLGTSTLRGGSETVMAARLTGRQPYEITVRYSSDTVQIRADWRAVDARSGKVYAITAPPTNMDERKREITIIAVEGEAA